MQCREYLMKYPGLLVLKLHPGGDLLLASSKILSHGIFKLISPFITSDKVGTLLIYNISLDSDGPRQVIMLSFEYGGISKICWLDTNSVAVGTTQGRIPHNHNITNISVRIRLHCRCTFSYFVHVVHPNNYMHIESEYIRWIQEWLSSIPRHWQRDHWWPFDSPFFDIYLTTHWTRLWKFGEIPTSQL
jgi:hypothetical protein